MRILHTSDWHLGVSLEQASREEEHERFLDWLVELMAEKEVDVLLHGGDVFHTSQPAARSLRLYYQFIARCAFEKHLRQIVIVGGNHDSAARLDAPRDALEMLRVYVVGGVGNQDLGWDHYLCPIKDDEGEVALVIAAMPYIHEAHLGVRTTGRKPNEIWRELTELFTWQYSSLAEAAEQRYPGVPMITTGHLTCYPERRYEEEDAPYHTPLHLVEAVGSLPPSIFDERFSYVALGHIHKHMVIEEANAWYPGSPIPTDVVESRTPSYVLLVDVDPYGDTKVERIEVPRWRPILEMVGSPKDVLKQIEELTWEGKLPPYLYIDFQVKTPQYDGLQRIDEILQKYDPEHRPRVVRLKETLIRDEDEELPEEIDSEVSLEQLKPSEVFSMMYTLRHEQPPTEELMTAFQSLLADQPD